MKSCLIRADGFTKTIHLNSNRTCYRLRERSDTPYVQAWRSGEVVPEDVPCLARDFYPHVRRVEATVYAEHGADREQVKSEANKLLRELFKEMGSMVAGT